jgi:hypothetical protein
MDFAIRMLTRRSRGARADEQTLKAPPSGNAFDYLMREPRHTRRLQRMRRITIAMVVLIAVASGLNGCT